MTLSDIIVRSVTAANRSWRVIVILYGSIFLFAAAAALGFQSALSSGFGDSMLPEGMLNGFDSTVYNDFMRANKGFLGPFISQAMWLTVLWMILHAFFGGGILAALKRGSWSSVAEFFSDCGTYLGRFILLLLISAFLLLILGTVWMMIVGVLYSAMTAGSITEVPNVIGFFLAAVVFLVPMMIIMMIVDYARVRIVVEETQSVLAATWQSTKFVFVNFFAVFGWQLSMMLLLVLLSALYWQLSEGLPMATGLGIFFAFVVQQVSVASRIWARLVTISGQIQLHESRSAGVVSTGAVGFVPPAALPLPPAPFVAEKITGPKKRTAPRKRVKRKAQRT